MILQPPTQASEKVQPVATCCQQHVMLLVRGIRILTFVPLSLEVDLTCMQAAYAEYAAAAAATTLQQCC
jgi:hypothetical protein